MNIERSVRKSFDVQAGWCEKLGSPFTALLLRGLSERLDRTSLTGRKILDWNGVPDATGDALALRLAGALHGLVRGGKAPELETRYPPNPLPLSQDLARAALGAIAQNDGEVWHWLKFAPQTNEVARAAMVYLGLRAIAKETGLRLSLFELGASAGLNLMLDKFSYRFGGECFGLSGSQVVLSPKWFGVMPGGIEPEIFARRGCDLNPLDVTDPTLRARLMAYIWPDQVQRLTRLAGAIEIARAAPPTLDKADAADWVERVIAPSPTNGIARVMFHTIAYQYFPETAKARIVAWMETAGAIATPDAPLAWLAFEQVEGLGPTLTLRLWRGGDGDGKTRVLAKANNAHVQEVTWLGG